MISWLKTYLCIIEQGKLIWLEAVNPYMTIKYVLWFRYSDLCRGGTDTASSFLVDRPWNQVLRVLISQTVVVHWLGEHDYDRVRHRQHLYSKSPQSAERENSRLTEITAGSKLPVQGYKQLWISLPLKAMLTASSPLSLSLSLHLSRLGWAACSRSCFQRDREKTLGWVSLGWPGKGAERCG